MLAAVAAAGGPRPCQLGRHHGWTAHPWPWVGGATDAVGSNWDVCLTRPGPKQRLEASVGPESSLRAELSCETT